MPTENATSSTSSWKIYLALTLTSSIVSTAVTTWALTNYFKSEQEDKQPQSDSTKKNTVEKGTQTNHNTPCVISQRHACALNTPMHKGSMLSKGLTFDELYAMSDETVKVTRLNKATTTSAATQYKTPESSRSQEDLPIGGSAARAVLLRYDSYSVVPSLTESKNELSDMDCPHTPNNSQEQLTDDEVARRKTELLSLTKEDCSTWPEDSFFMVKKNIPEQKRPIAEQKSKEPNNGWFGWPFQ